jgi:hypothetical protein
VKRGERRGRGAGREESMEVTRDGRAIEGVKSVSMLPLRLRERMLALKTKEEENMDAPNRFRRRNSLRLDDLASVLLRPLHQERNVVHNESEVTKAGTTVASSLLLVLDVLIFRAVALRQRGFSSQRGKRNDEKRT